MYDKAASVIKEAEVFILTAGAGMGVDSGLPDFRGNMGFWNAYPEYERLGLSFEQCANPNHFAYDPEFGWGFYGHRTNLYRETVPHEGFHLIQKWIARNNAEYFVVTSNVDGQFQRAGYADDRILEVHGSIHWLQCQRLCSSEIWENRESFVIDHETMRATGTLPGCPHCGITARPNILMFGDYDWASGRTNAQKRQFDRFIADNAKKRIVVIETGAGTSIPTIRRLSEQIGSRKNTTVIRINPREPQIKNPHISIATGALEGLRNIDSELAEK